MLIFSASGEQSVWVWLVVVGGLALIGLALYLLDRWATKRGHGSHPVVTRAGGAMLELQSLLEPSKRHVIEARKDKRKSDAGAGDDADTSGRDD